MKTQQSGFTLIELIVVIVILGILAAVAVPRFVDLSDEAEEATLKATAASMGSAMALNYAACIVSDDATKCVDIMDCEDVYNLLAPIGKPANYTVTAGAIGAAVGGTAECTVVSDKNSTLKAEFTGVRTAVATGSGD